MTMYVLDEFDISVCIPSTSLVRQPPDILNTHKPLTIRVDEGLEDKATSRRGRFVCLLAEQYARPGILTSWGKMD